MASFITSSFQYVFARTGFHSFSESVNFASLSFFRLISLFHNLYNSDLRCFFILALLLYRYFYVLSIILTVYSHGKDKIKKIFLSDRRDNAGIYGRIKVYVYKFHARYF